MTNINKILPETADSAGVANAERPTKEEEQLTDDEDAPGEQQQSKLQQLKANVTSWLLGENPRGVDLHELHEARGVTAFAKELMPALCKASSSPSALLSVKLFMFIGLNVLLVAMLFIYPRLSTYNYLKGELQVVNGMPEYKVQQSSWYGRVNLVTNDAWAEPPPDDNAQQLAEYDGLVSLPFDAPGDPGWSLQDLLDLPRTVDADLAYSNTTAGGRMVQDYRKCSTDCLDASGQPIDINSRDTSVTPYGQFGDVYVRRDLVLAAIDPDFFKQFMDSTMTTQLRSSRGNHGFDLSSIDAASTAASLLQDTVPTDSGYICNLGAPRKRLNAIQIFSKACYVQVVSAPGDSYQVYLRTHTEAGVTTSVVQTDSTNATSGCSSYTLDITAQAETCKRPQLVGVDPGCETTCAVVLFKGVNARRVPIRVVESPVPGSWPSTLHINDKFLVVPDLRVTGGSIAVNITAARIGTLSVSTTEGDITLDHARVDSAYINSTTDSVIVEDDRDTELQYRSGGNLLCAAAPLVEAIPDAFLGCNASAGRPKPHEWYESTQDGYIDRDEFSAGLTRLGFSYDRSSLDLDDAQQAQLLDVLFKDSSSGSAGDMVTLQDFNANVLKVKDLDFLADKYMLLDPWCYNGRLLKVRPSYTANAADSAASIAAAAMERDASGDVLDTRMPLYPKTAADLSTINPCPADWGNGVQGSTNYSHFTWANATVGYKWGKALPSWCLDESWPGTYPADSTVYGALAGKAVLPGCEARTCKPLYKVQVQAGSIHMQVLPYAQDAWNATGLYQTMLRQCEDSDGQQRCFYKGWADDHDASLHPKDQADWQTAMDACYADSEECSDTVQAVTVSGQGSPLHEKWFWSSRKVYMELEAAWYLIMSATLLKPDINQVRLRLSPGFCNAQLGAVEHIDWRRTAQYDQLLGLTADQATGVTILSQDTADDAAGAARNPALSQQGIRATRDRKIFERVVSVINGTAPERTGWFLKQSIRQDYKNESLMQSDVTADGTLDTNPGHMGSNGKLTNQGPWFKHKRVCVQGKNCQYEYAVYRDNCKVPRTAAVDPATKQPVLSPCAYADGSSAWQDAQLMQAGLTFNESAYYAQFPMPIEQYSIDHIHHMTGDDLIEQAQLADSNTHAWGNVTKLAYSKWSLQVAENGDLQFADGSNGWMDHKPLFGAVVLSLIIAVMTALLVVAMLVYAGLGTLDKVNKDLQARAKIELAVLEERKAAMFAEVLEKKRLMVKHARGKAAPRHSNLDQHLLSNSKPGSVAATNAQDSSRLPPLAPTTNPATRATSKAGTMDVAADAKYRAAEDVFLTEAEKTEILRVWDDQGFTTRTFRSWDKAELLNAWQQEVKLRGLPHDNPTLLLGNALVPSNKLTNFAKVVKNGFELRARADIVVGDAGPFKPAHRRTLDATELAADPTKLHKVESKLRYEENMNKLQRQYSKQTSSRRGSKEQQNLLASSPTEAASKVGPVQEGWRAKGQQMLAMNAERLRRVIEKMLQMCMISLPSPFQVISNAVVDCFQGWWVDSLATFLQVKCLFDHDMGTTEEILLGNCEQARADQGTWGVSRTSTGGTKPTTLHSAAVTANSSAGGKSKAGNSADGSQSAASTSGEQIEVDGEGDVIACDAVDGKKEVYRIKYVRVTLRSKVVMIPASEDDDSDRDSDDDEESDEDHTSVTCNIKVSVKNGNESDSGSTGVAAWSKSIGKTFARAKAVLVADDDECEDHQESGHALMKRKKQWELLIEEGPGVVSSSVYKPELEPLESMASQPGSKQLKRRVICLPCASKKELDLAEQHELTVDTAVRVRHYLVNTKTGRCVISINTTPDAVPGSSKQWLPGGKHIAPRISFSMPLSTFAPEYEKFCMQNELQAKDVLSSTAVLGKFQISMKKRVTATIKGLKQKAANVDSAEEQAVLAQDSVCFPKHLGDTTAAYDAEEDEPGLKHPLTSISGTGGMKPPAGRMAPLLPGSVPSFPGATAASEALAVYDKSEHLQQQQYSTAGSEQRPLPHQQRSTREGDSSDEDDTDQQQVTIPPTGIRSVTGGKTGSRRTTGTVPTTEAEAKAADKADKKRPAAKLQELLQKSHEPLAVFLRETYDITANYVSDEVELEVMQRQFRRWHRAAQQPPMPVPNAKAPSQSGAKSAQLTGAVAPEASHMAVPTAVPMMTTAPKQYPSGEDVCALGFKFQQQPEHTMFGVLVNQQDYSDDPRDANRSLYLAAELVSVLLHTVFIWVLPMPLFVIAIGFQGFYNTTTSIKPMATLEEFRLYPLVVLDLEFPLIKAMVLGGIVWVLFCYVKLLGHYLLHAYEDKPLGAVAKTVFWAYLTVMVGVLVAYVFEVFCWVILGAVINPNKFLPYSVAAVTLVAHARSTWGRLMDKFNGYRERLSSAVTEAFADKISTAEEATAQTENLLQAKLVEASDAVRTTAFLPGGEGQDGEENNLGREAMAGILGAAFGGVGAGALTVMAGSAIANSSSTARAGMMGMAAGSAVARGGAGAHGTRWPGLQGSDTGDAEGDVGGAARGASTAGLAAQASKLPSQQPSQVWAPAARRLSSTSAAGKQAAAPTAAAAGNAGAGRVSGSASKGDALECYSIFQMFASGDDSLDYSEFCALLEHLDIKLLEDKRRKLFARIDKSADGHIGYQEFQEGFELLNEQIVDRHMAKAGITMGRLIGLLVYAIVILLLVFIFIFLGVAAFTGASTMGAVVNSCMTAGAGLAMNLRGGRDDDDEEGDEEDVDISDA